MSMKLVRLIILVLLIAVPAAMILLSGTQTITSGLSKINWVIMIPLGIIFGMLMAFLKRQHSNDTTSDRK